MFLKVLTIIAFANLVFCRDLESVSDDDLVHIIKSEDNVIVLFTKKNCDECEDYETYLLALQDDFKEQLGANVIKAHNSQMVRLYNPAKEPALVYFRHGVPLLYHGPISEDSILHTFIENKHPVVKELSDANFEHLTQASSGATTGDWFIFFYSSDCIDCQRLNALWEAVGASLKNRVNVARMNRLENAISTAKRFNVQKSPEFLFFRQGKFYRYEIPHFEVPSFVSFAQEFYKNARAERVPVPSSPFDDLVATSVQYLKKGMEFVDRLYNHPYMIYFGVLGLAFVVTALVSKYKASKKVVTQKTKKSK